MNSTYARPSMGNAPAKPGKGDADIQRKLDAKAERLKEDREKAKARRRDAAVGGCRWPKCEYCAQKLGLRKEVAHVVNKSQGGPNDVTNLISFCHPIHQGSNSIHSGDKRVRPIDKVKGTSGPCRFDQKKGNAWVIAGLERTIGVFV